MNNLNPTESLKTAQKDYTARLLGCYFHATQQLLAECLLDKVISDSEIRLLLESLNQEYADKIGKIYE